MIQSRFLDYFDGAVEGERTELPMSQVNVRSAIEAAFTNEPMPDANQRISIQGVEGDRLSNALAGRSWKDLALSDLKVVPGSVLLLTPTAFKYFLPAYMLACTNEYRKAGVLIDSLVSKFIDPRLGKISLDALKSLRTDNAKGIAPDELETIKQMLIREQTDSGRIKSQHAKYLSEFSQFSKSQLEAVIKFVDWLIEEHPNDDLLGDYRRARMSLLSLLGDRI